MGASGDATLLARGSPAGDPGLVVVGDGDVPGWALHWCRRAGRELHCSREPVESVAAGTAGTGADLLVLPDEAAPAGGPVLVAIRALPADAPVLDAAAAAAAGLGCPVEVAHGVPVAFGERSIGLDAALDRGRELLDAALSRLQRAGVRATARLDRRWAHEMVAGDEEIGLLVLGRCDHDPARPLGPVARSALVHPAWPVLIVRRAS